MFMSMSGSTNSTNIIKWVDFWLHMQSQVCVVPNLSYLCVFPDYCTSDVTYILGVLVLFPICYIHVVPNITPNICCAPLAVCNNWWIPTVSHIMHFSDTDNNYTSDIFWTILSIQHWTGMFMHRITTITILTCLKICRKYSNWERLY